jgi:ankyrin repeat protein
LHDAADKGNREMIELLIENGADVNAANEVGMTPLHFARNREIAALLLDAHADPNARNKDGNTPLHWEACGGDLDVVELLVGSGADVHEKNSYRNTPLHCAVISSESDNTEDDKVIGIAGFLIQKGADVNAMNRDGNMPLHCILCDLHYEFSRKLELIKLLLKAGAKIDMKNKAGRTPLDIVQRAVKDNIAPDRDSKLVRITGSECGAYVEVLKLLRTPPDRL